MPRVSKEKNNEYQRKWYKENREKQYKKIKANQQRLKLFVQSYKVGKSCSTCGFSNPLALQFHHVDPSIKDRNIGSIYLTGRSIANIQKEIDKCVLLCANCHMIHHRSEQLPIDAPAG